MKFLISVEQNVRCNAAHKDWRKEGLGDTNHIALALGRESRIKYGCSGGRPLTLYLELNPICEFCAVVEKHTRRVPDPRELSRFWSVSLKFRMYFFVSLCLLPSVSSLIQVMRDALNTMMG